MAKASKGLKIKIVGCGGIGSWLVDPLCSLLNFSLIPSIEVSLIDGDTYEERNRERQNFDVIGPKASITAARLKEKFPRLFIQDHPAYLTDANIIQLVRDGDIVVCCVDNHKTRKLVSDRAEELDNVTVVSGGNELTDGNVLIHVRRDGKDITLPLANKYHPELQNPGDKNPGDDKEHGCQVLQAVEPQLVATNFMVAAFMLSELYKIVTGHERVGKSSEVNFDILTGNAKAQLRS